MKPLFENLTRNSSIEEKQAYKNLSDYDSGYYKPQFHQRDLVYKELSFQNFSGNKLQHLIDNKFIEEIILYAQTINGRHSDFKRGVYSDKNAFYSTFSKLLYYENTLEMIVQLFISHLQVHAFYDGNKRTALNLFLDLLNKYSRYNIRNILKVQDLQIMFIEKEIDKDEFIQIILNEIEVNQMNTSKKCHFEHLIPRSQEIGEENTGYGVAQGSRKTDFTLSDLENGQFFYQQLKKPYFQRDTNEWTVDRVEKLISTFLSDGLIPAIILWEDHNGDMLIIDGAHRISSLIAWVNNDYGNDQIDGSTNSTQIENYINSQFGSYSDIKYSNNIKDKSLKKTIAKKAIQIQWVTGDYQTVKESFIRINEQGVEISNDEKELILKDHLPMSKLARGISSCGTGQNSHFKNEEVYEIYKRLFLPTLVKESDYYPMFGSLEDNFTISKIYNSIKIIGDTTEELDTLTKTYHAHIKYIQDYLEISNKVYFYGANLRFKVASLYGFLEFSKSLRENNQLLIDFIKHRKEFEEFITRNERYVQAIARKRRQSSNAYKDVANYYRKVIESLVNRDMSILYDFYSYLPVEDEKRTARQLDIQSKYVDSLDKIRRCNICNGYIDGKNSYEEKFSHAVCRDRLEV